METTIFAEQTAPLPEFGVLFLGSFADTVLGFGLAKSGGSLKAGRAVLGAALGGVCPCYSGWRCLGSLIISGVKIAKSKLDILPKHGYLTFLLNLKIPVVLET